MKHMKVGEAVVLAISREDLFLLSSSVGEAIEAVDDWEFSTRLGYDKAEARRLLDELNEVVGNLAISD